jgi:hypothetical protein
MNLKSLAKQSIMVHTELSERFERKEAEENQNES